MSYEFYGLPSYVLANKLKALKVDLKKWNEDVFGDVGKKKNELFEGIQELDIIAECRCLVEEERVRKRDGENSPFLGNELKTEITSFVVEGGGKNTIFSQGGQFTSQIQSCGLFEYKWCYVQESY
jgi:hypothetical protein